MKWRRRNAVEVNKVAALQKIMNIEIGFSLGSNLGDRLQHLQQAKAMILEQAEAELLAQSPVYETEPIGVKVEYRELKFLNCVLIISSAWPAEMWLSILQKIEKELGRVRTADQFAPRPIDVDILYAGETLIDSGGLEVPHPRWAERRFVVQPLSDVRPDLVLPGSGQTVGEVLAQLSEVDPLKTVTRDW